MRASKTAVRDFSSITKRLKTEARKRRASAATGDPASSNLLSIQQQIDAIGRGDFETVFASAAPDATLEIFVPPEFPWIRKAKGPSALREAAMHNFGTVEDQRPEIKNVHADGDTIVLFGREQGRLKETGVDYDLEFVQKFTFRDGRLSSVQIIGARASS